VISRPALRAELVLRIACDIHFPSEALLDPPQGRHQIGHAHASDDEKVDVAPCPFLPAGDGAIDCGPMDAASERREFGRQEGYNSGCL
jgi:hypothetical protein